MTGKVGSVEKFGQKFVRRVPDHLHLFDDHTLLAGQIVGVETRIGQHVGQQIKGLWQRCIDYLQGKTGDFMGGVGIKMPTQTIGFRGDLARRTAFAALEQSVLNEMANPVERRRFVA